MKYIYIHKLQIQVCDVMCARLLSRVVCRAVLTVAIARLLTAFDGVLVVLDDLVAQACLGVRVGGRVQIGLALEQRGLQT